MTRFLFTCSLIAALSVTASAERAPHFARPPADVPTFQPEEPWVAPVALDRATVRAALLRARAANLAAFRAYQTKGVFPSNVYATTKLNVWRDQDGHYCAAATIIKMSGQTDLVERVAEQNNYIRLADVSQGPLMDWILTSGFTQEEIAAIQAPFVPVTRHPTPEPSRPMIVASDLRAKENARLRAIYFSVDKQLVASQRASLEVAVDRLMKHPTLAWQLIVG